MLPIIQYYSYGGLLCNTAFSSQRARRYDKNMEYALEKVAEMGYSFVEFAGFFGIPAKEIKRMLDNTGLRVSGTHTGWQEIAFDFEKTVEYHKEIGNENIIIPGADLSDSKKLDDFINVINEFGPKLAEHGINLHYHNHSFEFQPNKDGQIVHEEMQRRSDILFQIDPTGHTIHSDPVELINALLTACASSTSKTATKGEGFALGEARPVRQCVRPPLSCMTIVVESETLIDGLSKSSAASSPEDPRQ